MSVLIPSLTSKVTSSSFRFDEGEDRTVTKPKTESPLLIWQLHHTILLAQLRSEVPY